MKSSLFKFSARIYGRTVFATIINFFVYFSIIMVATVLSNTEGKMPDVALNIVNAVALIVEVLIFVTTVFTPLWDLGYKDSNAVSYHHKQENLFTGVIVGLIASIPAFVGYLVLVAEKAIGFFSALPAWYRIVNMTFYPLFTWLFGSAATTGSTTLSWSAVALSALPLLVLPIACGISYLLGYKGISIHEKMVYKQKK